jgi:ubiquinone/menaquinone biosynthesis C-methylase UbiE
VAERRAPPAYDRIAHLYDVDMAQNMRFRDVDFYARIATSTRGRVLELGCGNGRILLELVARGVDAVGVDRSQRMLADLQRKATARALPVRACAMDVRRLGFRATHFDAVLCPYSLVTYMTDEDDAHAMLGEAKRVLSAGGSIVVDAFISRPIASANTFARDYVRPFGERSLVRSKRITVLSERVNRIERRYEIVSASGAVEETIDTCEDIRVYSPAELIALLNAADLRVREAWWDYTSTRELADAQFFTVVAGKEERYFG